MPAARTCSECRATLADKAARARTCSATCRSRRSKRLRRNKVDAGYAAGAPEHQRQIADYVRGEAPDVAHDVIADELRPVVREAITEDVLRAIDRMVGLTPRVVEAIEEDLHGPDPVLRQRAYSLVAKYTIGHHALVTPKDTDPNQQLVVNFNLPRPDSPGGETLDVEAQELRTCDSCATEKPAHEFVATSSRCQTCFDAQQAHVKELLG